MRLLAIETSTTLGGVAIMDDDALLAESRINVKVTHSERIMSEIDHTLKMAGLTMDDIDVFAVAIGPGSFTGLRVGLSTAKGLVYATGKKLVSVPTLEALAWSLPYSRYQVCPVLDARKKEVYAAIFKWSDNGFVRATDECPIKIDTLLSLINEPTVFLGEGALIYKDSIEKRLLNNAIFAQPHIMVPSSSNVAYLGMIKAKKREYENPIKLVPRYLRKSEAEIKQTAE
ncbi:MAG: tRNA (adenosine(37)-N6)-threonylcarbamoyltransferase complex dimerization subunit type 1 TsaB [Thermodesulfovibrionales bacterium]|nr:tRNA (adenosine(37)-N6)-threonylcarbamoyltransferase complex dimerization subunit type 1 TsaB [Thermodesulfovibrionales bacterium]